MISLWAVPFFDQKVRLNQVLTFFFFHWLITRTANDEMLAWLRLSWPLENYKFYVISVTLRFPSAVTFTILYWPALYRDSTAQLIWFFAVWRCPVSPALRGFLLCQCLGIFYFLKAVSPKVWFDIRRQLTVYLHLYIWMSVCSWQMASVSHLYSCLFTDETVSNVFSVAFRFCDDDDSFLCLREDMYLFLYWENIIYFQKIILTK